MNVLGLTDECKDLRIFGLRTRRLFTPREGSKQPLSLARLSSRFLSSPWKQPVPATQC